MRVEQHFKFRPSDRCIRGVDPQYRKNYEHGTTFAVCCCYTCLDHCHRKWARYLLYICRGGHGGRSWLREAPEVPTNALQALCHVLNHRGFTNGIRVCVLGNSPLMLEWGSAKKHPACTRVHAVGLAARPSSRKRTRSRLRQA